MRFDKVTAATQQAISPVCPACKRRLPLAPEPASDHPLLEFLRLEEHLEHVYEALLHLSRDRQTFIKVFEGDEYKVPLLAKQVALQLYLQAYAMAVRRLTDGGADTLSAVSFLVAFRQRAKLFDRDWFVDRYGRFDPADRYNDAYRECQVTFDRLAGNGADHVDPRTDLQELRKASTNCRAYSDSFYAHTLREPTAAALMARELDTCRDLLTRIVAKYSLLLCHKSLSKEVSMLW